MQESLDLKEILQVLVRRLYIIIVCAAAGFAGMYTISQFVIPPKYTSSISLYVNNSTEFQSTGAVNLSDLNTSQRLVNTYIVILQNDEMLEQVADRLLEEFDSWLLEEWLELHETASGMNVAGLRKVIRMTSVNNTEVLKIDAETRSAVLSARICTIMAETAPEVLIRVVKAGSVEVIGAAKVAGVQSSPNVFNYSIIGGLAGMALSVIIVLLVYVLDNTVKDEDDIKKRYNIPILGEIPDFSSNQKGGYYRYGA